MLMNNLDPEVAERPQDLVVYGGTGKAARNWECYDAIVETLRSLQNDETLLVASGTNPRRASSGSTSAQLPIRPTETGRAVRFASSHQPTASSREAVERSR